MAAPVIGITTSVGLSQERPAILLRRTYVEALIRAGGTPLLIPVGLGEDGWRTLYKHLGGLLFSGGGDIAPRYLGVEPHEELRDVDDQRDELEFALLKAALADGKPFLGICRGLQVLNVCLGGTLYSDIAAQMPGALEHARSATTERTLRAHRVTVEADSRLAAICGEVCFPVNSLHHQGVKRVASTLRAAALAPDGLVEALELPGHPFGLAVQWHPEELLDEPVSQRLFRAFVEACRR